MPERVVHGGISVGWPTRTSSSRGVKWYFKGLVCIWFLFSVFRLQRLVFNFWVFIILGAKSTSYL